MMLTGDEAWAFFEELRARHGDERAETLARAKLDAERRGKEPFDLVKLETMADTSSEGRIAPENERWARFEYKYYVTFSEVLTLEEFAREVAELNRW